MAGQRDLGFLYSERQPRDHYLPTGYADMEELETRCLLDMVKDRLTIVDSHSIRQNMGSIKDPSITREGFQTRANYIIAQLAHSAVKSTNGLDRKVAISIRAGLAFLPHAIRFMPGVEFGFSTQTREEELIDLPVTSNNAKLGDFRGKDAIVFDPMLATGGSMVDLIDDVVERGARSVTTVSAFTAPQGLVRVSHHPAVARMITTPLEAGLNEQGYIVGNHLPNPMLGDFGDRYFGDV